MRRVLLSIVGTIAGLAALLSFKTHAGAGAHPLPTLAGPAAPISSSAPASPSSTAPPEPGTTQHRSEFGALDQRPGSVEDGGRAGDPDPVRRRPGASGGGRQDHHSVSFLQLTADDPRSADINSQAGPILLQQTMQAQSANIDGVSGATYTSEGYLQSLQSALDQAGA